MLELVELHAISGERKPLIFAVDRKLDSPDRSIKQLVDLIGELHKPADSNHQRNEEKQGARISVQ